MKRNFTIVALFALVCLSACSAAGTGDYTAAAPAGFWSGLLHGMISWFAFVLSLFGVDVSIYETVNNGAWYDFGFLMGVGSTVGGTSVSTSRRRRSE